MVTANRRMWRVRDRLARVRVSIYTLLYSISSKVAIEKDEKIQFFSKNAQSPFSKGFFSAIMLIDMTVTTTLCERMNANGYK